MKVVRGYNGKLPFYGGKPRDTGKTWFRELYDPVSITYDGTTYNSYDGGLTWDSYLSVTNVNIKPIINDICTTLGWATNLNFLNVSAVTEFFGLFSTNARNYPGSTPVDNTLFNGRVDGWNTGNVISMMYTFANNLVFNTSLNSWNTGNVITMNGMFLGTRDFNQSLNDWNVKNVTTMLEMFRNSTSFNKNINSWNVGNVTNMREMFKGAIIFNQPLNSWNTESVTAMRSMFEDAVSFDQPLSNWDTSSVTDMIQMFKGRNPSAPTKFNQDISMWDVSFVTNIPSMFAYADKFNQDLSGWCVGNVISSSGFDNGASSWVLPKPNFANPPC